MWHQVTFIRILFKKVCKNHHVRTKTSASKRKTTIKKLSQPLGSAEDSNSSMAALLPLDFVLFAMALSGGLNQLKNRAHLKKIKVWAESRSSSFSNETEDTVLTGTLKYKTSWSILTYCSTGKITYHSRSAAVWRTQEMSKACKWI